MATDRVPPSGRRRQLLLATCAGLAVPGLVDAAAPARATSLAAAWDENDAHWIGVIELGADACRIRQRLEVPTRAHDLLSLSDGSIIAVARRPGEWMVRWYPRHAKPQWRWSEPGQTFNGHALVDVAGAVLVSTETDTESGDGLVGVRDLRTLALRSLWKTHGRDPHMLLADGTALLVANGGILALPETGRTRRDLDRMDASLVRLDTRGRVAGQWHLEDPRLSVRHLARSGALVGVALQAEHDDPALRERAPLLALFDGETLRVVDAGGQSTGGYAGDIAAFDVARDAGFVLGASRAGQVFGWDPRRGFRSIARLAGACAVTASRGGWWSAGPGEAVRLEPSDGGPRVAGQHFPPGLRIDNHWRPVAA